MKIETHTAYPLEWPDGWPRAKSRKDFHPFGSRTYPLTFDSARQDLLGELKRLGAKNVVLSTNVPLRSDGMPHASAARTRIDDPGVAVYFTLKDRPLAMARDGFANIAANVRSLYLAVEGLRQMERHGGSYMMERAFSGFLALPAPGAARSWREVLNFGANIDVDRDTIDRAFRQRLLIAHPDRGGSHDAMAELNAARAAALKEIG